MCPIDLGRPAPEADLNLPPPVDIEGEQIEWEESELEQSRISLGRDLFK